MSARLNVSGVSGTGVTDVVAGGNTYAYQVKATNATGDSAWATTGSVTTVPDAPAGVTAHCHQRHGSVQHLDADEWRDRLYRRAPG